MNVDNIEIGFFSQKKVIPLNYKIGSFLISNIKIPDLIVRNKRDKNICLSSIDIIGINSEKEIVRYKIHKNELAKIIEIVTPQINNLIDSKESDNSLKMLFGKTKSLESKLKSSYYLKREEATLIPLSLMLYFHYIGLKTIEELRIDITFAGEKENTTIHFPIELFSYNSKDKFIFPMKGKLCICNLPMNLPQHRKAHSQEFAIDIIGQDSYFSDFQINTNVEDYTVYDKDIFAVADGVVVEIGDKFPDAEMSNPKNYTEAYFKKLSSKLIPKIGLKNTFLGNYIIIKHSANEYSLYAHLKENSICLKPDDRVQQGDLIAKVGNTGNSTEPHLHFQLNDSDNLFEADGLPIRFKNIHDDNMNQHFSEANSLINSDYCFVSFK